MVSNPWFKVWGAETLLSESLQQLTDHEERVWWRLLCNASLMDDRWTAPVTPALASKCMSKPRRFEAALGRLAELGMVELLDEGRAYRISNAERYQRKPSDRAEATRERQRRRRESLAVSRVTQRDLSRPCHATEEEEEEEEKKKQRERRGEAERHAEMRDAAGAVAPGPTDPGHQLPLSERVRAIDAARERGTGSGERGADTAADREAWGRAKAHLSRELNPRTFDAWVAACEFACRGSDGRLYVQTPDALALPWLNERLSFVAQRAASREFDEVMEVRFVAADATPGQKEAAG